jgi:hypothetical protein
MEKFFLSLLPQCFFSGGIIFIKGDEGGVGGYSGGGGNTARTTAKTVAGGAEARRRPSGGRGCAQTRSVVR